MRTPGTFYDHSAKTEYVALSRAADAAGVPAHVITNAISNGSLPVREVSGCKAVAVADLLKLKGRVTAPPAPVAMPTLYVRTVRENMESNGLTPAEAEGELLDKGYPGHAVKGRA